MNYWVLKTEPSEFSYANLEEKKKAVWDGITNPLALKYIRSMGKGDLAFIYHTGDEKQITGIARITSGAYPDPRDDTGKLSVVDLAPLQRLKKPITLTSLKAKRDFADWELVRIGRLSVVPVDEERWKKLKKLGGL
ncbi:MAG: EVE domain-containing protein [Verrucomicrobiae bacterium]|nr:EVE domain-containing protein [Verrucomicrobiae bacterium]